MKPAGRTCRRHVRQAAQRDCQKGGKGALEIGWAADSTGGARGTNPIERTPAGGILTDASGGPGETNRRDRRSPRPCATPPSRRTASRGSGGTEGPTRGQNKKGACRTKLHRERRRRWRLGWSRRGSASAVSWSLLDHCFTHNGHHHDKTADTCGQRRHLTEGEPDPCGRQRDLQSFYQ
jgi:hypothetical protein